MDPADYAELKYLAGRLLEHRTRQASQCSGKFAFDNRVDANKAVRPHVLGRVAIYRCMCGKWHIGSDSEQRRWEKAAAARKRATCAKGNRG